MRTDHSKEFLIRFLCYGGFVFRWQPYRTLSSNWNHDHCKGCSARFAERPDEWADPVHTEGWVTLWPIANAGETETKNSSQNGVRPGKPRFLLAKLRGFQLDWHCSKCFETCRQELGFVVDPKHPQWQQLGL